MFILILKQVNNRTIALERSVDLTQCDINLFTPPWAKANTSREVQIFTVRCGWSCGRSKNCLNFVFFDHF